MSLFWRVEREDKPVRWKMAIVPKKADEELWYLDIVKMPRDEDLSVQSPSDAVGELTNRGIGPEKKRRAPAVNISLKKTNTAKAQSSNVKNAKGEKRGTYHSSNSWCDYVPKAEPQDAVDIPAPNADDPIDLESSPEPLLKTKAGKRKQTEVDAEAQPVKKVQKRKITRRGNLDAITVKPPPEKPTSHVHAEPSSAVHEDLSPLHLVHRSVNSWGVLKLVVDPETTDVGAAHPKSPKVVVRDPEKGKFAQEDHVATYPTSTFASASVNIEKNPAGDQGYFAQVNENSPIHPNETPGAYYCRCYSEKQADEVHAPVWKLKKEWSVAGWKRKAEAEVALLSKERKNLREICEKDNNEKIGLHNVINNLKAEVERLKKQDADIEKLKQEKAEAEAARDEARSHWDRTCATLAPKEKEIDELTSLLSKQEQLKAEVEFVKKDLQLERVERVETSRRLSETEEKLESSEIARATMESQIKPLKNDMLWLKECRIISVANYVLYADELDEIVAHLLIAARNDGYAQGYAKCSHHVTNALIVDWDTSRPATQGLPIMDLVTVALQSEDFVTQLREVFSDRDDDADEDLA
ncbi:hypothetical protein Hanom_Chr05g00391591 [Helianthus anomalus]